MKLIKAAEPPCDHYSRATTFFHEHGSVWAVGTIVECDCGKTLVLREDQRNGLYWNVQTSPVVP